MKQLRILMVDHIQRGLKRAWGAPRRGTRPRSPSTPPAGHVRPGLCSTLSRMGFLGFPPRGPPPLQGGSCPRASGQRPAEGGDIARAGRATGRPRCKSVAIVDTRQKPRRLGACGRMRRRKRWLSSYAAIASSRIRTPPRVAGARAGPGRNG